MRRVADTSPTQIVLELASPTAGARYAIELRGPSGVVVWSGETEGAVGDSHLSLLLRAGLLELGEHRFEIEALDASSGLNAARYPFLVE